MYLYEPKQNPAAPAPVRRAGLGQLGRAAGVLPAAKRLQHTHVPKAPHPTTAGAFVTGAATLLAPANMDPGYFSAGGTVILDQSPTGLQTCLAKLITSQFKSYLSNPSNTSPTANDRLRVALVDRPGPKRARPDLAAWGSTVAMYGASVPKILAVYAAHQLREDLRRLAADQSITTGAPLAAAALKVWKGKITAPNLVWLFDIRRWTAAAGPLDFSAAAKQSLAGIMHNHHAGDLIAKVGFDYINSVTWQSGLYHSTRGGLWLTSSYGRGGSGSNPVGAPHSANVTALSVATFFTLLAQGRLVDDAASAEMTRVLRGGCVTGLFPSLPAVASKCGIYGDYLHDCALVDDGTVRYVVAGLTRTKRADFAKYTALFSELHRLIVANNVVPKSAC